jgi:hypothetical protein
MILRPGRCWPHQVAINRAPTDDRALDAIGDAELYPPFEGLVLMKCPIGLPSYGNHLLLGPR